MAPAHFLKKIPGPPCLTAREVVQIFRATTEAEKAGHSERNSLVGRASSAEKRPGRQAKFTLGRRTRSGRSSAAPPRGGVPQLERELGRLAAKVARRIAGKEIEQATLERDDVRPLLGRPRVHPEKANREDRIGTATGMYYTPAGGDIMFIEAAPMRGKGELILTGQLGDVMRESARAAWTFARANAAWLGIADQVFERDVHIHVPAGAIPKDGPSAGIAMATAIVSALSGRAARHDVAVTGEITLSGRVLPIGGLKEKVLGAVRAGIERFVIPRDNAADLDDLPADVLERLTVTPVDTLGEALAITLRDTTLQDGRLRFGERPAVEAPRLAH